MIYFGFFCGMEYGTCSDDFSTYETLQNTLSKSIILTYLKKLPISAVAPMTTKDIFTGEPLKQAGIIEDGAFCFPIDFIHYYETYNIGIPAEYEQYLMQNMHLSIP